MKTNTLFLFISLCAFVACTKDENSIDLKQTITCNIQDICTKTSLDGLNMKWSNNDKISLFEAADTSKGDIKYVFSISEGEGTSSATFTAPSGFPLDGFADGKSYVVGYNVRRLYNTSYKYIYYDIPATQFFVDGNPHNMKTGVIPMVGTISVGNSSYPKDNITFQYGVAVISFKLTNNTFSAIKISKVELKTNITEASIGLASEGSTIGYWSTGGTIAQFPRSHSPFTPTTSKTITLKKDSGYITINKDATTEFCFMVLPKFDVGDLTFTFYDDTETVIKSFVKNSAGVLDNGKLYKASGSI